MDFKDSRFFHAAYTVLLELQTAQTLAHYAMGFEDEESIQFATGRIFIAILEG